MKALRGIKRACHACAARFYDLSRDPIVCPACGAQHVPDAIPAAAEGGTRAARFAVKTGWRGRSFKHRELDARAETDAAPEVPSTEDAHEEALVTTPNDDVVLEEEPDEADISGLLSRHDSEPKER